MKLECCDCFAFPNRWRGVRAFGSDLCLSLRLGIGGASRCFVATGVSASSSTDVGLGDVLFFFVVGLALGKGCTGAGLVP